VGRWPRASSAAASGEVVALGELDSGATSDRCGNLDGGVVASGEISDGTSSAAGRPQVSWAMEAAGSTATLFLGHCPHIGEWGSVCVSSLKNVFGNFITYFSYWIQRPLEIA
jgi:hypothetical protein